MPTKIRLQRKGKKGQPFYHIVIADGRAPRDGKFIEKIGTYNPLVKPADIDLDFEKALYWLQTGAQPTDTVRAILSYKGILYKNHLQKGVTKGALTQEQADAKFDGWLKDKEAKIAGAASEVENESRDDRKKRLDAEKKVNEERAKMLAERRLAELKAEQAEVAEEVVAETEAEVADETTEAPAEAETAPEAETAEVKEEAPKAEEKAEVTEEIKEEKVEVAEEVKEEKAEVAEEVKEEKAEETKEEEKTKVKAEEKAEEAKEEEVKEEEAETAEKKDEAAPEEKTGDDEQKKKAE